MSIKIKNQELKEKLLNVSGVEVPPIVEKSSYVRSKTEYARMVGAQGVLDFWQKMYEDGTVIIPQELERGTPLYDEIDTLYQKKGGVEGLADRGMTIVEYSSESEPNSPYRFQIMDSHGFNKEFNLVPSYPDEAPLDLQIAIKHPSLQGGPYSENIALTVDTLEDAAVVLNSIRPSGENSQNLSPVSLSLKVDSTSYYPNNTNIFLRKEYADRTGLTGLSDIFNPNHPQGTKRPLTAGNNNPFRSKGFHDAMEASISSRAQALGRYFAYEKESVADANPSTLMSFLHVGFDRENQSTFTETVNTMLDTGQKHLSSSFQAYDVNNPLHLNLYNSTTHNVSQFRQIEKITGYEKDDFYYRSVGSDFTALMQERFYVDEFRKDKALGEAAAGFARDALNSDNSFGSSYTYGLDKQLKKQLLNLPEERSISAVGSILAVGEYIQNERGKNEQKRFGERVGVNFEGGVEVSDRDFQKLAVASFVNATAPSQAEAKIAYDTAIKVLDNDFLDKSYGDMLYRSTLYNNSHDMHMATIDEQLMKTTILEKQVSSVEGMGSVPAIAQTLRQAIRDSYNFNVDNIGTKWTSPDAFSNCEYEIAISEHCRKDGDPLYAYHLQEHILSEQAVVRVEEILEKNKHEYDYQGFYPSHVVGEVEYTVDNFDKYKQFAPRPEDMRSEKLLPDFELRDPRHKQVSFDYEDTISVNGVDYDVGRFATKVQEVAVHSIWAEQDLSAFPSRAVVQQMEIAKRERGVEKSRDRDDSGFDMR